jgi:nitroimidazol reductase NimA-like FMN-containing flavoprotein (pyridoxamine 5'-phosphate oxidase superfamily)
MQEAEINELLNRYIYLRMAMMNERDGSPLVHPIWYYYEDGKFFAVSYAGGMKIRSLKKNPEAYFLVDIADRGVRGRAKAKVIDDPEYAKKRTTRNLIRYMGSSDSPEAKARIEFAKNYSAIEITPYFVASWKA